MYIQQLFLSPVPHSLFASSFAWTLKTEHDKSTRNSTKTPLCKSTSITIFASCMRIPTLGLSFRVTMQSICMEMIIFFVLPSLASAKILSHVNSKMCIVCIFCDRIHIHIIDNSSICITFVSFDQCAYREAFTFTDSFLLGVLL
jgi:hypothetical protein